MSFKLLVINPGSTSTKLGVYDDETPILVETLRHTSEEICKYKNIYDQFQFRKNVILDSLKKCKVDISTLHGVIGRGGLLKPISGGTYIVNERMLEDLKSGVQGQHASNLGGIIAHEIAKELNLTAYIVDPVVVDELHDVARISGIPEIERKSIFHALNQKAVGKKYANESGKKYEELNVIVAHMGGGISVGAHLKGKIVQVNNALDGDGPLSPERSGNVPIGDLIRLCYSGKYTLEEVMNKINSKGGYMAHFGTNDDRVVEQAAIDGDKKAKAVRDAMLYQVSLEIGKCAAVLNGKVDAIILTGGIAYSSSAVEYIKEKVAFIAEIIVYPGEDELLALVQGGLSVLKGEEVNKVYI
ncbi:butyrate kinase [Clostridium psychrophilum]|uniref:butyrate kinase n=1 Tax=Clostridium psychrophilum TaxID=132926 RepID=UPI001C0C51BD|nr:butyrate kinase [Clostridium psychrophilum]MBU3181104.1 butyrate kinase [Clostridium psychrophilum]